MTFPVRVGAVYGANQHTVHGGAGMRSALAGGGLAGNPLKPLNLPASLPPPPTVSEQYRGFLQNDASMLAVISQLASLAFNYESAKAQYERVQKAYRTCWDKARERGAFARSACKRQHDVGPAAGRLRMIKAQHDKLVDDFRAAEQRALARMTQTHQHGGAIIQPVIVDGNIVYEIQGGDGTQYPSVQEAEAVIDLARAEEGQAEAEHWREEAKEDEVSLALKQRVTSTLPWLLIAGAAVGGYLLLGRRRR